jgi:hypothetical protein
MVTAGLDEDEARALNSEARQAHWRPGRLAATYKFVHDTAARSLRDHGGDGSLDRDRLFAAADDMLVRSLTPLVSRVAEKRLPGGGRVKQALHVVFLPVEAESSSRERIFQLHSLRLEVGPGMIETECTPLPFAFREHAAVRLVSRGQDVGPALRQVAVDLAHSTLMLSLAEPVVVSSLSGDMHFPAFRGNGLVLGTYHPSYALAAGRVDKIAHGRREASYVPADPLTPAMYVANTYLGFAEMKDDERDLKERLEEWRNSMGERYYLALSATLWPGLFGDRVPAEADVTSLETLLADDASSECLTWRARRANPFRPCQADSSRHEPTVGARPGAWPA